MEKLFIEESKEDHELLKAELRALFRIRSDWYLDVQEYIDKIITILNTKE